MGWRIALAVVVALACLPLGVDVRYDAQGPRVRLLAGPFQLTLYPRPPKKEKKPKKTKDTKEKPKNKQEAPQSSPEAPAKSGGSWTDFIPLVKTALAFLGDFRRKLRIRRLECNLILGGTDPAKLAISYGRAWAAVGNLLAALEGAFVIRKRDVEVQCDFTCPETRVTFRAQITITLGRLLALAVRYGLRALKQFLALRKSRKGGMNHE